MQNPNPRSLLDFLNVHPGETAVLFGKGPSLDAWIRGQESGVSDPGSDRQAVIAAFINDTIAYQSELLAPISGSQLSTPNSQLRSYCFANDGIALWHDLYRPGHVLFQPRRILTEITHQAPAPACECIIFDDSGPSLQGRETPALLLKRGLATLHGTAGSALQILCIMGVRHIVCVGFDGGSARADRPWRVPLKPTAAQDYADIRRDFIHAAATLGVFIEFYGEPPMSTSQPFVSFRTPNATATLRIISATCVKGTSVAVDDLVEVDAETASILIGCGRAERWVAPAPPPVIETAAVEPRAETAAIQNQSSPQRKKRPSQSSQSPAANS